MIRFHRCWGKRFLYVVELNVLVIVLTLFYIDGFKVFGRGLCCFL